MKRPLILLGVLTLGAALGDHQTEAASTCSAFRFAPPATVLVPVGTQGVVSVGDRNGDGRADAVVLEGSTLRLYLQQQDGTFVSGPPLVVSPLAFSVELADDVILLRADGPQIVRSRSDGSLEPGPDPTGGPALAATSPLAVGDVDGDGRRDVLAVAAGTLWFYRAEDSGAFTAHGSLTLPYAVNRLVPGDFDGDGKLDLFLVGPEDYPNFRPMSLLLFGDGQGGFRVGPAFHLPQVSTVAVADFDRDGRTDFLYSGLATGASSHYIVSGLARGSAAEGLTFSYVDVGTLSGLLAGDFDGDGIPDVAIGPSPAVRRGLGDGTFGDVLYPSDPSLLVRSWWQVAVSDLDGDGRPDIFGIGGGGLVVARNVCASTLPDRLAPALVSVTGVNGARYETELTIDDVGVFGGDLRLELRYVPSVGGGGGTATVDIPERGQLVLNPAFEALARLGVPVPTTGERVGTLAIRALSNPSVLPAVTSRVTSPAGTGRAGVAIPGVPLGRGFSADAVVGWLREDGSDRTNVAFVHPGGPGEEPITLRPTVVSTDPDHPGTFDLPEVSLAPGGFFQLNRVLRLAGAARSGFLRVRRVAGSAPFFAYGVVNDEGTSDGSYVSSFEPSRPAAKRWTIPAIVESGRYTSDLVVTNAGGSARSLSFRFVCENLTVLDRTARFTLDVPPNGQIFLTDLVDRLRQQGVEGIGPRGVEYVGALFAELAGEGASDLFLGVRVSAPKPEGRYGVFTEAVPDGLLAGFQSEIPAVRQDAETRTNIAVVNAGASRTTFTIEALDPSRGGFGAGNAITLTLDPGRWAQVDSALLALRSGLTSGRVLITGRAEVFPTLYLACGVTNDGARPGVATDDGSYIPMFVP